MREVVVSLFMMLMASAPALAFVIEDRTTFGPNNADTVLRVVSTADIGFFAPIVRPFLDGNPNLAIDYTVASSSDVMRAVHDQGLAYDLVISSAMDLQTKLANDGLALSYRSPSTLALPDWANWRDQVFAFTQEPATIVVSNAAFDELDIPRNRQELISVMRENPERFRGRVGTYDVRQSGLGYLFATQDARASETYWRLAEVMGGLRAKLYCCSSDMINDVVSGDLLIAYNVLGSYALNHDDEDAFTIVLPSDFTTVMLRTAIIPLTSENPDLAGRLVDHLVSQSGSGKMNFLTGTGVLGAAKEISLRRIQLGPGLLVYLDRFKNRSFVSEWESAILQ